MLSDEQDKTICKTCLKFSTKTAKLMLLHNREWSTTLRNVCSFAHKAMLKIVNFKPNLMPIGKNQNFERFCSIFSYFVDCLSNKRHKLQHISGMLIQIAPTLLL